MENTRATLLSRMKKAGSDPAWEEFYERYATVLLNYSQRLCGEPQMAEDVLQETMMVLLRELPDFHYEPARGKFRNYLLTILHNRCRAALRRAGRENRLVEIIHPALLEKMPDPNAIPPDQQLTAAWCASCEAEAWRRVRETCGFDTRNLAAYEALTNRGLSPAEVAREFGLTTNHVHQVKNKIGQRVQQELRDLLAGLGEAVPQ